MRLTRKEHCVIAFGCAWWANAGTLEVFGFGVDLVIDPVVFVVPLDVRIGPWLMRVGVNR